MMSQRFPYLAVLLAAAICLGCQSRSDRQADHPVLKVSLEECSVSLSDLFKRVEFVPLATTEESLFAQADKIEMHHDTIFLFDRASRVLHIFAPDGGPIRSIRKVGRGRANTRRSATLQLTRSSGPSCCSIRRADSSNTVSTGHSSGNVHCPVRP